MHYPQAVCLLGFRQGKVLAISRRNDTTQWGFPGGKVDAGESLLQALLREIKEETGFNLYSNRVLAFYSDVCEGDVTYDVVTFFYMDELPEIEAFTPEEGMTLEYKNFEYLLKSENSPFSDYNSLVYDNYNRFLKECMDSTGDTFLSKLNFLPNV